MRDTRGSSSFQKTKTHLSLEIYLIMNVVYVQESCLWKIVTSDDKIIVALATTIRNSSSF